MISLVNGCGTMGLRERLGGEWRWTLNLAVHGADGVLLMECLVWGYRRIVGKDGRNFCVILDLWWGDGSNIRFWPLLWLTWIFMVATTNGM